MDKKYQIYFISYFYPPTKAVGTIRNYYISHLFAEDDKYNVSVYTANPIGYIGKDDLPVDKRIRLLRSLALDYHFLDFYIKKKRAKTKKIANTTGPSFKSYFPMNVLIGEGGFLYIIFTFLRMLINIRKIDILWTSYSPFSDLYIASLLKRIKPSIFWVTDWRDVDIDVDWPDNAKTQRQKRINKKLFGKCDLVVSVSEGYIKYVEKYGDKKYLLRNGIKDKYQFDPRKVKKDKFSISYVGGLYGGRRDPSPFFRILSTLIDSGKIKKEDVELIYAGQEGTLYKALAEKHGLASCVKDRGFITFQESQEIQRSSQMNLMISWISPKMNTFPAKFYEYVNAWRPIILLILGGIRDLEFEKIFEETNVGRIVYDEGDYLKIGQNYILDRYTEWKSTGLVEHKPIEGSLDQFYWKNSYEKFDSELTKMLNR